MQSRMSFTAPRPTARFRRLAVLSPGFMLALLGLLGLPGCGATHAQRTDVMPTGNRVLTIELLALDLKTCGRCTGTDANLDSAIATVADVLREADVEVMVRRTVVSNAAQAEALRFESSPTIRINGRDIALEFRESNCGDCGDLCGCEGGVDCRVWVWQGREHTAAPKALIVDAILRSYGEAWDPIHAPSEAFRLPENLHAFFKARPNGTASADADCCDRTTCCDESERAICCGTASGPGSASAASSGACGCKG